jgi:hypothetical protein
MPHIVQTWRYRAIQATKIVATALSAGAALVSMLSFARSLGLLDQSTVGRLAAANATTSHGIPDAEIAWFGITPAADSAASIGDTIHLSARLTDKRGATIAGATVAWSSDSAEIASVTSDGTVIARAPGTTTIFAAVGAHLSRAHVTVHQRVVAARITSDSARLPVDAHRPLIAEGLDARDHVVEQRTLAWRSTDSAVVRIDSTGTAIGIAPGHASVVATIDGVPTRQELVVVDLPAKLALTAGEGQHAATGHTLKHAIEAEVRSARNRPVADVAVHFVVDATDGQTEVATARTDAHGRAHARWPLGGSPGRQTLLVTADGITDTVAMIAEADPVAANVRATSINERASGGVGELLPADAGIRLTDSLGRALPGVPVSWTTHDGGTVSAATARTDSLGESRVHWKLGTHSGTQRAIVTIGDGRLVPRATIAATATPGTATSLAIVAGDRQVATAGSMLDRSVVLRALDKNGNAVPAAAVTLMPNSGSVGDSSVQTDSSGSVRVRWTLGHDAGAQRLMAKLPGLKTSTTTVGALARPRSAVNMAFAQAEAEGQAGKPLATDPSVLVTDAYGNPVPEKMVRFAVKSGTVTPARVLTDAAGHATTHWRLGSSLGEQQLAASANDGELKAVLTAKVAATKEVAKKATAPAKKAARKRKTR